jgi:nicotinamidase-related amidase
MDYQQGILTSLPGLPDPEALLSRVRGAVIAYVRVGFTEADWAVIPSGNKTFSNIGQQRLMHYADPATDFHDKLTPEAGDITVRKTRYGALSTTDLDRQLQDRGPDHVLAGFHAPGGDRLVGDPGERGPILTAAEW